MHRRRPIFWLLALASVLALVAAGCGGDGDDGGDGEGAPAAEQTITYAWGAEPPSLDPALATDTTSAQVLLNIMDPLVKLEGEDLEATPALAESWDASEDGTVYTFHLRDDGMWTNGEPVTAQQFEWSWKRVLDPETAAEYAYQLYGIEGAEEYNSCEGNECERLREEVGVRAVDERTLEVTLTSAQPWFPQVVAHHIFLAVPQEVVEQHGRNWTEAQNIVTNGPFQLENWEHESRLDLVKWDDWRGADDVTLTRVDGRIIVEGTTAVQSFEAGEVQVLDGQIPTAEVARLKETPEWYSAPSLATYFYGFNTENVPDVNQRRAMSLAIDRRTIVERITQSGEEPATGFTPAGMAGFDTIHPESEWLPAEGDIERAKELMEQVEDPNTNITLIFNNAPGHREIAVAIQGMWRELGINTELRQQEWAQFLEFIGPPPNNQVDVYRLGWLYDYPDALNGLEMWTCESGNNSTNWCSQEYDSAISDARATPEDTERYDKYAALEEMLVGADGELPIVPIYWYTNTTLVSQTIEGFDLNPQGFVDFTKLSVSE